MDTSKVIRGVVNSGRYTVTAPIVKEDYGLYLQIEGVELPQTYEVDFSNSESNGTSVTMIGNADGVLIPSQFISSGKDVFAFLYHVGANYGRTVYKFRIPNKVRPDRTNEQPTPEEQSVIDQAISALNTAVAQTAQDKADADVSAQSASADAERAEEARTDAQNYATQAEQARDDAQTYANNASASATASAQSASQSAQIKSDVEDLVDDAQGYASASAQGASASATSATQAQGYAQSASASAQSASGYASNAQTSANTASTKAQDASQSASTASQKATESAQSASQALTYKTDAESAKTASQTAQGLAESARDSAITAKNDAEQAKADAESARDEAVQAVASISDALADKADIITDTASGAIASFSDGADDLPLKSLVVNVDPVQDLHGYVSPWPAGGGKNKFDVDAWIALPRQTNWYSVVDDVVSVNANDGSGITNRTLQFKPNTQYTISFTNPSACRVFDESGNTILQTGSLTSGSFTTTESGLIAIKFYGSTYPTVIGKVQIEEGSTATAWSPYENLCPISGWTQVDVNHSDADMTNPTTITIDLGQTVYGGKLDVLSGKLVIDRAMVDLGTLTWGLDTGQSHRFLAYNQVVAKPTGNYSVAANAICSTYKNLTQNQLYSNNIGVSIQPMSGKSVYVYDDAYDNATAFKSAMSGVQLLYELATPIEIQLSANQLNSLYGVNNLWADSGDSEVEYRADTKAWVQRKIAEAIASLT